MNAPALRVISLGWGVQSFALAAMVALGELPPVDVALHADTVNEHAATYRFSERWTPWLEERGVRVVTVCDSTALNAMMRPGSTQTHVPAFTIDPEGNVGKLRRSCTGRWKIAPQRRWIRQELAARGLRPTEGIVEQWFGITLDEWTRMKQGDVKYIRHAYPFMEAFEPPMSRHDVALWLQRKGLEIPPKSSCVFCPFHDRRAWRNALQDWRDRRWAIAVDRSIRDARPGRKTYLLPTGEPLEEADLRNEEERGQLAFWGEGECQGGYCFL